MPFQAVNQWLSNISGQTPINTQVPVNEKKKDKLLHDFYLMQDEETSRKSNNHRGGRNKAFRNGNNYNARRNDAHHMKPLSRSIAPKAPRGKKDKSKKTSNNRIRVGNKSYLS